MSAPKSLFLLIIRQKSGIPQAAVLSGDAKSVLPSLTEARLPGAETKGNDMTSLMHIKPVAATILLVAIGLAGATTAAADDGKVVVGLNQAVHYRHLDFNRPQDRLALLV